MAKGLLGFLGFSKRAKPSFNSPVARPTQEQLHFTPQLRDLVQRRVFKGQDLGYGEDFTSKATSPAIANLESSFQEKTLPFLSSELSKRGVARSAGAGLATDVLGRAELQKNRDVNELISRFQVLNENQKKQDYGQALKLGENMQTQQAGLLSDVAQEGERVRDLSVEQTNIQNKAADVRQGRTMQAIAALIGAAVGGPAGAAIGGSLFGGGQGGQTPSGGIALGSKPGVGKISTYGQENVPVGFGGRPSGAPMEDLGSPVAGRNLLQNIGQALGTLGTSNVNLGGIDDDVLDYLIKLKLKQSQGGF